MTPQPLFSVLIANYNDSAYLMTAIESVLAQSYPFWEIIIVDDCSNDDSWRIVTGLDDPKIHAYRNDVNHGCGSTKRKCIELAHGEICGFVDADDCITPNAIETMVDIHLQNPECSLVYSKCYYTDSDLEIVSLSQHQCTIPQGETFLTSNIPGAVSHFATFKKAFYEQTEGINASLRAAEDLDLYYKLEEVGNILFIPTPLYYYRTNTGNNTTLGMDNLHKTLGWDVIAKSCACQRRGLPIEDYSFCNLKTTLSYLYEDALQQGANDVRRTKAYRLGRTLLRPFSWTRRK